MLPGSPCFCLFLRSGAFAGAVFTGGHRSWRRRATMPQVARRWPADAWPDVTVTTADYNADRRHAGKDQSHARPSAGLWVSPRRPPIPISALRSGCRRLRPGTENISRKAPAVRRQYRSPADVAEPLEAGYATLATDNGHVTDDEAPNGGSERAGGWAIPRR